MTAEWRPDPEGRYEYRWWDGQQWTDQVAQGGQVGTSPMAGGDAVGEESSDAAAQPQAEAQPQAQVVDQGAYAQPQGGYAQPQGGGYAQPTGGGAGQEAFPGITGDLVDGRYSEREAQAIANQNAKMLRVRCGEPFMARQGAMVAYQGNLQFDYEGGGVGKFLKKAVTGEGLSLMRVGGQGDVFLADLANDVHLLQMTNAGISISGKNVLAFSASLQWDIERVKGGSIAAGGLFNTTLRGTGWVAITTDGPPVVLNAAEAPTFADAQALVAWSADLQTSIKSSFKASALIGRGSGELFQVAFQGYGFVIVQPSEGFQYGQVQG